MSYICNVQSSTVFYRELTVGEKLDHFILEPNLYPSNLVKAIVPLVSWKCPLPPPGPNVTRQLDLPHRNGLLNFLIILETNLILVEQSENAVLYSVNLLSLGYLYSVRLYSAKL